MRTQFFNRIQAAYYYKQKRKIWSREAAWYLTCTCHAVEPTKRIAAALTCCRYGIYDRCLPHTPATRQDYVPYVKNSP